MEQDKIKLIDEILQFMLDQKCEFNITCNGRNITEKGFERDFFWREWNILIKQKDLIIISEHSDKIYQLTNNGIIAAKIGIENYCIEKEKERILELKAKNASVRSVNLSRWAICVSIIALLASIIVPFSVVKYEYSMKNNNSSDIINKKNKLEMKYKVQSINQKKYK